MDFFEHQDRARRSTSYLVLLLALAVILTVLGVYLAVVLLLVTVGLETASDGLLALLWDPFLFGVVASLTVLLVGIGTLSKMSDLAGGGSRLAVELGGRPVDPATDELDERQLLNVVEEMAIASGVPVPAVHLLDGEDGVNAFAAGFEPGDAVIGVTRGTVERLSRDELQGVVAHEFSHIAHGDMHLNLRLIGWVHGILLIALTGRVLVEFSGFRSHHRSRRKSSPGIWLFGLAVLGIGSLGTLFSRMIKGAVSRQREFLADASAVQYTRNPRGLLGALARIDRTSSRLATPKAEEASHLYFADGLGKRLWRWSATHPPLDERIGRLDPHGAYRDELARLAEAAPEGVSQPPADTGEAAAAPTAPPPAAAGFAPREWVAGLGRIDAEGVARSATLLATLPDELTAAARRVDDAEALVLALLLDRDPAVRRRQRADLRSFRSPEALGRIEGLSPTVDDLGADHRLPLVSLAAPALRRLSPERYGRLRHLVRRMAGADGKTDLFEVGLERVLTRHLDQHFRPGAADRPRHRSLERVRQPLARLLSALAHRGHPRSEAARAAFERGVASLGDDVPALELIAPWELEPQRLGEALDELAGLPALLRRAVLTAAAETAHHDGRITPRERELLRLVAEVLGAPAPPLGAGAEGDEADRTRAGSLPPGPER